LDLALRADLSFNVMRKCKDNLMQTVKVKTNNTSWGLLGSAERYGYNVQMTWDCCSKVLSSTFALTPEKIQRLLDARFGRHLADDLSFIPGGPRSTAAITKHLEALLADPQWCDWFNEAIAEARAKPRA
jgi:hypothetical protein